MSMTIAVYVPPAAESIADIQCLIGVDSALAVRVKEETIKRRKYRGGCLRRLWWRDDGGPRWGFQLANDCMFFGDTPAEAYRNYCGWGHGNRPAYRGPGA